MPPAKKNVLVIDTCSQNRKFISEVLTSHGYFPIQATSVRDALQIADQFKLELVVTGLELPDVDGVTGIKRIRKVYPRLNFVAMAGSGGNADMLRQQARMLGIDSSLSKPFTADELMEKVEAHAMDFSGKPSDRKKILVIDEDRQSSGSIRKTMEDAGYSVSCAANAEEAIYSMRVNKIDLVLTEIFVSGIGGIEGIMKMRAQWPEMKIVAMSAGREGISGEKAVEAAQKVGADYGLPKPFHDLQLVGAVKTLLG